MRDRVTTKVIAATTLAIVIVTGALLVIAWQWQASNADQLQADCQRELVEAIERSDRTTLTAHGGAPLRQEIAAALPTHVRLVSVRLTSLAGSLLAQISPQRPPQSAPDGSFSSDAVLAWLAGYLSPLPATDRIRCDVNMRGVSGRPQRVHMFAVLDMSEMRAQYVSQIEEIMQIFLPVALACLFGLFLGVKHWVHRPAEAIIRVARRIAEGDQGLRLAITTGDEFGQIMRAFNDLTDALLATQQQADTDGLTQVFNHRYLQEKIGETLLGASQAGRPMAIILIDLNKFKLLNDTYGHLVGDRYLQQTASVLRRAVHLDGVVGRYGGDEFLIILPHAGKERAQQAAQRIRSLMAAENFRPYQAADSLPMSFSMGEAVFPDNGRTTQELIAYADAALYTEKQGGYNLVELTRDIEAEYSLKCSDSGRKAQPGGLFGTLFSLVVAVDNKDDYTKRHSVHVADWAVRLGQAVELPSKTLRVLQVAGLLHDVGKIGVPDSILRKPGPLEADEQQIMAGHVLLSEHLIQEVPYQDEVVEAVACHHERWDGHGYPRMRLGAEMPIVGRIMGLVDAYSAMCMDRPYRRAMKVDEICEQLRQGAGSQFDPGLVPALIDLVRAHEAGASPGETSEGTLTSSRAAAGERKPCQNAA